MDWRPAAAAGTTVERQIRAEACDSLYVREISDSLAAAFDRIGDFQSVQRGRSGDELCEAVELLQESVGIKAEERSLICERLGAIGGSDRAPGHVLLGLIIGLMATEGL